MLKVKPFIKANGKHDEACNRIVHQSKIRGEMLERSHRVEDNEARIQQLPAPKAVQVNNGNRKIYDMTGGTRKERRNTK